MYIGEIIKSYREQHNMTVEEFANKSNLSQAEITQLEEYEKAMGIQRFRGYRLRFYRRDSAARNGKRHH